jgi:hypothetical protein
MVNKTGIGLKQEQIEEIDKQRNFLFSNNILKKRAICAEIGVWRGWFSRRVLNELSPKKLYLIDPYILEPWDTPRVHASKGNQSKLNKIASDIINSFKQHSNVTFYHKKSQDVASEFLDKYFDWIYIDGDHRYEFVKKDLELYGPKIKTGGLIVGDDYIWKKNNPIKRALHEFLERKTFELIEIKNNQFIIKKTK